MGHGPSEHLLHPPATHSGSKQGAKNTTGLPDGVLVFLAGCKSHRLPLPSPRRHDALIIDSNPGLAAKWKSHLFVRLFLRIPGFRDDPRMIANDFRLISVDRG